MLRFQVKRTAEIELPISQGLFRQASDQIETNVVESAGAQRLDGARSVVGGVCAAQPDQLAVDERLHADTGAVDARGAPALDLRGAKGSGIDLNGHLGFGIDCK